MVVASKEVVIYSALHGDMQLYKIRVLSNE